VISIGLIGRVGFYREALRDYLNRQTGFAVTDLGRDGPDALDRARCVRPDILLIDLPPIEIIGIAAALQAAGVDTMILAMLFDEVDEDVLHLAEAGVAGFIPVTATFEQFFREIRSSIRTIWRSRPVNPGSCPGEAEIQAATLVL
jgi:DNA-binding NarL/FixJ family response regulator